MLAMRAGGGRVEGAGLVQAVGLLHRAHGGGGPPPGHAAADQLQRQRAGRLWPGRRAPEAGRVAAEHLAVSTARLQRRGQRAGSCKEAGRAVGQQLRGMWAAWERGLQGKGPHTRQALLFKTL
jgi:hypothetical protein